MNASSSTPDESSDSFRAKFERQLAGAPAETVQLAAEVMYVHLLVADDMGQQTKAKLIADTLALNPETPSLPDDLAEALSHGLAATGVAFKTYRPFQLALIIELIRAWKKQPRDERERLLDDPWAFKQFLFAIPIHAAYAQREALLHFVHPETFDAIISRDFKARIAAAFADRVHEPTDDVDEQLLQIRVSLRKELGYDFNFWDPEVLPRWNPPSRAGSNAWIFQANPKYYDIDTALRELQTIEWTVRQYRNEVRAGDRAYIWRSGDGGSIVAIGTVANDPADKSPDPAEDPYYRDRSAFDRLEPRVTITIDTVLPEPLAAADLKNDPVLESCQFCIFATQLSFGSINQST